MATRYNSQIVKNGLVLCLDAGNIKSYVGSGTSWKDLSNNGNSATLTNGPTFSTSNGGIFTFNGSSNYVTTNLLLSQTSYTKCAWFNTSNTTYANNILSGGSNAQHAFWLGTTQNLCAGHNGGWYTVQGSTTISLNTWYFGAVTYSSTAGWNLYVNGRLESTSASTTTFTGNTQNVYIGAYDSGNFFIGSIGVGEIYNRVLSADEILQNYNATRRRFGL